MKWVKELLRFLWGQITEALDAGLIALFSVVLYFGLMFSGSEYYARGVELNLAMVKRFAVYVPDMYGWNVGGMFLNIAIGQNAEKVLFYAEIALLVTFVYLAIKRTLRQCRRLLWRRLHKDTGAPPEETRPQLNNHQPKPTEGVKTMRTLGRFYSAIADLLWLLTVLAFAYLLVPQIRGLSPDVLSMQVPAQGGVTVAKLLVQFMPPFLIALVTFNFLAGRWAVAQDVKRDLWVSRFAFVSLVILIALTGVINKWATGLPEDLDTMVKIGVFGSAAFAFGDMMYMKGGAFRASSLQDPAYTQLQEENERLRQQLARHGAVRQANAAPAPGTAPAAAPVDLPVNVRAVVMQPLYLKPGETAPEVGAAA